MKWDNNCNFIELGRETGKKSVIALGLARQAGTVSDVQASTQLGSTVSFTVSVLIGNLKRMPIIRPGLRIRRWVKHTKVDCEQYSTMEICEIITPTIFDVPKYPG